MYRFWQSLEFAANGPLLVLVSDNHFVDDYARFSTLSTKEKSTAVANSMNYMTKKGKNASKDGWSRGSFFLR